ncbi:TonB family protein [Pontibacter sp. Tf4]|uniref:energy transducer TonB n=1 Tax=Pontibacter sp. Tf4 TaxID=2761620 RepID=UPI0016240093|nr:energy transducer TonB [Pontibacter sp. Tf4]MBB6609556.1 TonB family protein [Pontibacter sp. Tf4]
MRSSLLTALVILFTLSYSSAQTIKYLSKSGRSEVPATEAHYFEVEEKNKEGWGGTRTRYLVSDSSKVSLANYSNLNGGLLGRGVLEGMYYEWYPNGKLQTEAVYVKGELHGPSKTWYQSGQLHYIQHYQNYKLQDTLKAWYETGELRRIEVYNQNELVSGKLFDRDGKELEFFRMVEMPEFKGGERQLMRHLAQNTVYPKSAYKRGVGGIVMVAFVVSKTGVIKYIEVVQPVDPELDAEAVRVVQTLPAWNPALIEGEPEDMAFTLPFRFHASTKWNNKL